MTVVHPFLSGNSSIAGKYLQDKGVRAIDFWGKMWEVKSMTKRNLPYTFEIDKVL
ncbi:MAG: hypothetical protein ACYDHG_05520 [Desulfomonilaceae bacterium]